MHQQAEKGERVGRVGDPIFVENSVIRRRDSPQTLVVLVARVDRCDPVSDGKSNRAQKRAADFQGPHRSFYYTGRSRSSITQTRDSGEIPLTKRIGFATPPPLDVAVSRTYQSGAGGRARITRKASGIARGP